jgi:DNA-binding CsgD family transcriptional regulator
VRSYADTTLAASGLTNKQIAERLYLSHRTVSSHLYKLFPKLGVSSRVALRAALAALAAPCPQQAGEDSHLADAGNGPTPRLGLAGDAAVEPDRPDFTQELESMFVA